MPGRSEIAVCSRIRRAFEAGAPGGSCLGERDEARMTDKFVSGL